jgi:phospholipid-binding lipoprotein MlaA
MPQQMGDFGQTLACWGVGDGPYLMLPLLGPSNLRDAIGRGVDFALSPWQYLTLMGGMDTFIRYETTSFSADVLVRREQNIEKVDAMRADTVDTYAALRSAWRQHRAMQIGKPMEADIPEIEDAK